MGRYLLVSPSSIPAFLRSYVNGADLRLESITPCDSGMFMMAVIGCRIWSMHFFGKQVGSGSKSHDFFGELKINPFITRLRFDEILVVSLH